MLCLFVVPVEVEVVMLPPVLLIILVMPEMQVVDLVEVLVGTQILNLEQGELLVLLTQIIQQLQEILVVLQTQVQVMEPYHQVVVVLAELVLMVRVLLDTLPQVLVWVKVV
jgi:hypothetical protein